jgi:hypothetical protein
MSGDASTLHSRLVRNLHAPLLTSPETTLQNFCTLAAYNFICTRAISSVSCIGRSHRHDALRERGVVTSVRGGTMSGEVVEAHSASTRSVLW